MSINESNALTKANNGYSGHNNNNECDDINTDN